MTNMTLAQKEKLDFLRWGPLPEVCREFFHVEHRDRPGDVVPFNMNPGQMMAWDTAMTALNLNLEMEIRKVKEGGRSYIKNLKDRVAKKQPIGEWEIGLRIINGKARRGGFTTLWDHVGFRRMLTVPAYKIGLFAQSKETASELYKKVTDSYDKWPVEWLTLRPKAVNQSMVRFELKNRSSCSVRTAGAANIKSESARGWAFELLHLSEHAWYANYRDTNQAIAVQRPHHWTIYESTANGVGNPFEKVWKKSATVEDVRKAWESGDSDFFSSWSGVYRFFFPWFKDPGNTIHVFDYERTKFQESLDEDERALIREYGEEMTLAHLKWRRDTMSRMDSGNMEKEQFFRQEFPASAEEMFQTSSSRVFPHAKLARQLKVASETAPVWRGLCSADGLPRRSDSISNLTIFEMPKPGRQYVIGADVSHGVGKDYQVADVLDRSNGLDLKQVAEFRSNTVSAADFGHIIVMLAELFNRAYCIVETQGGGLQCLDAIYFDCGYSNIYTRRNLDATAVSLPDRRQMGFPMSRQTKARIVNTTRESLDKDLLALFSVVAIQEMMSFQEDDEGRLGAPPGENDDCVMSLCLATWAHFRAAPKVRSIRREEANRGLPRTIEVEHDEYWKFIASMLDRAAKKNRRRKSERLLPSADQI